MRGYLEKRKTSIRAFLFPRAFQLSLRAFLFSRGFQLSHEKCHCVVFSHWNHLHYYDVNFIYYLRWLLVVRIVDYSSRFVLWCCYCNLGPLLTDHILKARLPGNKRWATLSLKCCGLASYLSSDDTRVGKTKEMFVSSRIKLSQYIKTQHHSPLFTEPIESGGNILAKAALILKKRNCKK